MTSADDIALSLAQICLDAARPVMEVYTSRFEVQHKADHSVVTDADRLAEDLILDALARAFPSIPVVSEEAFSTGVRPEVSERFFLVDPVDGTREFVSRNGEFTVNIGLIDNAEPVAGCVYAPALERLYAGASLAWAADARPGDRVDDLGRTRIQTRPLRKASLTALVSRSHLTDQTQAFLKRHQITETMKAGSSLKFCRIAEGAADIYPRFGPTMEWDTAAGHAVLAAAGGTVRAPDGRVFSYGKCNDGLRNGPFIACGGALGTFL